MEIIFLVLVLHFKGEKTIQKEEYHTYAEKWKINIPCEKYISRKKSESDIRKRFKAKGKMNLHCVRASKMEEWESKNNVMQKPEEQPISEIKEYIGVLGKVESTGAGKQVMGDYGYQGTNYFLSHSEEGELPVHVTEAVKAAQLDKLIGKKVKITGEYFEKHPHPMEQAPITYNPITKESQTIPRRGVKTQKIEEVK